MLYHAALSKVSCTSEQNGFYLGQHIGLVKAECTGGFYVEMCDYPQTVSIKRGGNKNNKHACV